MSRLVGPIYNGVVAAELMLQKMLDRIVEPVSESVLENRVTILVKTFERPDILKRLVDSIRKFYPEIPVIVVDDSRNPLELVGVETIILPYDSGVSAGRNAGLAQVKTPYVLLLDDDYIFYRHTGIASVLASMERNLDIDILGGERVDLPFFSTVDYSEAKLFPSSEKSNHPEGTWIGGFKVFDKVANFYIARADRLRLIGWDSALKRIDHADFFTRAKGVLTIAFDPSFKVLHAQNRFDRNYMGHRNDYMADRLVLKYKYGRK
jgi:glycosyltransferase involved in cell wall biosynthesis